METLLKISAHDNAAIKQYRKLARSRKERTKAGLFVLEGFRLVSDAVKNGAALTQLFWTEDGLARWQAEGLPTAWDGVRCAQLSDSLAAELSDGTFTGCVCHLSDAPAAGTFRIDPRRRQLRRAASATGSRQCRHDPADGGRTGAGRRDLQCQL